MKYRLTSLIIHEVLTILSNGEKNMKAIIGEVKSSYNRMRKILSRMENYGVVESRRSNRNKLYCITAQGEEVLKILDGLKGLLY